ncbi:MAG: phosphomannomutase/phosphoglucomutase [Proteobacteria bacterium]|nr:phosphomannomutase/phosphoglucomutase [Pseudomonadota bacterium]
MKAAHLSKDILREYDIRGTVGKTLQSEDALALGQRFGTYIKNLGGDHVCVARDGRLSSLSLLEPLIFGLRETGLHVNDIGLGPTPMLYFAVKEFGFSGGIMVTGSHNPPQDNGFKLLLNKRPFFGQDIQNLLWIDPVFEKELGRYHIMDVKEAYLTKLLQDYKKPQKKRLKIAWDPGNGATGEIVGRLIQQIDADHMLINGDIDGRFPAHHPDPTLIENLEPLITLVKEHQFDIGIAFDGDGDRIGVIDGKGRVLWGDHLLMILAEDLLKRCPKATIIADVKTSQTLFDFVQEKGGTPLMWKTGHSLIKSKMAETGALLAGEMSGHIFIADHYYGFDDGLYAAIRLIEILQNKEESLSEIYDRLPKMVSTPEIRIPCSDEKKFHFIKKIQNHLQQKGIDIITLDGVRVQTYDGWWLLRASNTQPILVARCEATTKERLKELLQIVKNEVESVGLTFDITKTST